MAMINEQFLSGGHRVPLEVFLPAAAAGKHPMVLVLHGSLGCSRCTGPTLSLSRRRWPRMGSRPRPRPD